MDTGIIALIVAGCVGGGACIGGYSAFSQEFGSERSLNDPDFYYLVDEAGDPVGQVAN